MREKIWVLKRCNLFATLKPAELQRLERHALLRSFKARDIIYFPTDPGQSVMVLTRGRVKIKAITPDGKETIFAFVNEGEIFGELAIFDCEPRKEYAEAVKESQVVAIPRDDMNWLIGHRPDIALHVTQLLGFRIRRVENRLRNIMFRSNRERILALLVELLESHGQPQGTRWDIGLSLSHQDLANLIGATRETVTTTLGKLQHERILEVHRQRITILDRERLISLAEGQEVPVPIGRRVVPTRSEHLA